MYKQELKQQPMKSTIMTHDPKFGYLEYLASPKNIIQHIMQLTKSLGTIIKEIQALFFLDLTADVLGSVHIDKDGKVNR